MGVLSIILLILFVIASLLLVFIVAIQTESGTGLGGIFGGGSDSTFGSQTGKVLNRVTAILGTAFLVLAIVLAVINKSPADNSLLDVVNVEQVQGQNEWWN
ncbi:MAG: preprotein translocase subunit SecG [Sphaerochaetaceae bacterium]|jgi:preprotein translocase subunit SecG|nr:preprotein translocase subunit SecG [Sphaerochaetaceae bacterium]NLO61137.1 preprotein translocase subunit SecG [Spirochaetales bacterium]MDD2405639.1 preprotein translocase subunit SecG [Sphaerochaetaceae bacterium]MDD3670428.1 preprotein translocase subunit SecG [Sphaerochaetaceae bacterium]MDD4260424.1 preprotein translocase subunit SecG [Sphaerochaetaceae bacterium]